MFFFVLIKFADRSFLVANCREGQCHIIYCSDGFCRLTGYSRADVMQRPGSCDFLCGPHTSQQAVTMLKEALKEGVEKHAEILYYRKDGKQIHMLKEKQKQYKKVHHSFKNRHIFNYSVIISF